MNNSTKNIILAPFNLLYKISPAAELKLLFRLQQGYSLDLKNPKTFNEKLQWIKLYDKNPLMTECCDKYAVRRVVSDLGCENILNELYWSGYDPEKIPFDELPDQFVIKVTHGSTFNIFCRDKKSLDRQYVIRACKKWLKDPYLPCYGEWFYGKVKPRVIVEKFIESTDDEQLRDYKVFCFHGEPKYVRIDSDRFTDHKSDFFTSDWERVSGANTGFHCSNRDFEKPEELDDLLKYARKLSSPFMHARVDFYIADHKVIFGEITFTSGAGFNRFSSYDFDLEMGSHLHLK